jgi:hypothetical protein
MNEALRTAAFGKPLRKPAPVEKQDDDGAKPSVGRLAAPAEGPTPDTGDGVNDNLRAQLRRARGYS